MQEEAVLRMKKKKLYNEVTKEEKNYLDIFLHNCELKKLNNGFNVAKWENILSRF